MSKSLKIEFGDDGATILLNDVVEDFEAVSQNAIVNIATEQGSDSSSSDRGTNLLRHALQGRVADLLSAQHISNLAAIDTLFFLRNSDETDTEEERLVSVKLEPFEYDGKNLKLNVIFTGTEGTVLGRETTL